eukprot:TRINITY_DN14584_c0_g1_i1.p1 TRINITY_DN14584_c0_g1~~TRINITY_DN14584_c0_g1_i1.p1  ORF type:complete len:330 (-),score=8.14 TRINITY_DN14584_c0_g1_i1:327-1316(-)
MASHSRIRYEPPSKSMGRTDSMVFGEMEAENGKASTPKLPGISLPSSPSVTSRPTPQVSPKAPAGSAPVLSRSSPAVVQSSKSAAPSAKSAHAGTTLGPPVNRSARAHSKSPPPPLASSKRTTVTNSAVAGKAARPAPHAKPKIEYGRVPYRSKYDPGTVMVLKEYYDEMVDPATGTVNRESFRDAFERRKEQGKIDLFSESFFDVVDSDGSESITFKELLRLMFPNANKRDVEYMMDVAFPVTKQQARPTELNPTQKQELVDIFRLYDDDDSGEITVEEFRKATQGLGMQKAEITQMIEDIDADGSGTITLDEFLEGMKKSYLGPAIT